MRVGTWEQREWKKMEGGEDHGGGEGIGEFSSDIKSETDMHNVFICQTRLILLTIALCTA
jgi:hypothetical protein